ncbi:MAG: hypothetical protein R6U96_14470 [Promethearchaeia archaeon]
MSEKVENGKPQEDLLIESLWILSSKSGICIYEENYEDITKDGINVDLISSFISALLTFADEAFTDEIKHIKFANRKIVFHFSDYFLFVIAVNDQAPATDAQIKKVIFKIAEKFNDKYYTLFAEDKWNGNIETFDPFSKELRKIVKKEPIAEKFLQLLGVKEHLKRVEGFLNDKREKILEHRKKIENVLKSKKRIKDLLPKR